MMLEARNMEKFRSNFDKYDSIIFPKVVHSFVRPSILVESYEVGLRIVHQFICLVYDLVQ